MPNTQTEMSGGASETALRELSDFSIVSGGLLHRLWRRTGLCGDALELTGRRVLVTAFVTWVPLLLLTIVEGNAWGGSGRVSFLQDVETHARLLIAAPLFILAELRVHKVLSRLVRLFVERGLIRDPDRPRFDAAVASAVRLRNSVVPELLLIAFVYGVGLPFVWRDRVALGVSSWYATVEGGQLRASLAGWWVALVSMPVLQFLVLRWFLRFFIWGRFLWQVSRIRLSLEPTHPDRTAGLHFLARSGRAFNVVLLAFGTVLAGMMANRIFYEGAKLLQFKVEVVGVVGLLLLLVLGPLLVFYRPLRAARRLGMEEYGTLGQLYAREFDRRWVRGGHPPDDGSLLGSADIQSLADLHNGYAMIERIRLVPFGMKNVTGLVAPILLPVAPLLLTMLSVEQLIDRVLKALF